MKPRYETGFLESNLKRCKSLSACEGACGSHGGHVMPVRVIDKAGTGWDWGYFAYCQSAIEEDEGRGFLVLREGERGFNPLPAAKGAERSEI